MAISPILEQEDSRIILENLSASSKTIKELNELLLSTKLIDISTATLYRRIKELYSAGYIEKLAEGSYIISELGRVAYNELYKNKKKLDEKPSLHIDLISQLSSKDSDILRKLQQQSTYTSKLLSRTAISPNDLLKIIDKLIQLHLIDVVEKPGKKPGRPKKIYKLTENGYLILQYIEELKQKLQRK